MRSIKVTNCQECPFCNNDNEYGFDQCNLSEVTSGHWERELPSDSIHKDCPLKKEGVSVSV